MRYIVSDNVEHGCCFVASVRDTTTKDYPTDQEGALVCECMSTETAQMITDLLNAKEP